MEDFAAFFRSAWVVWLMALFVAIVAWALWPSNRERFRRAAHIPLSDDDERPRRSEPAPDSAPGAAGKNGA